MAIRWMFFLIMGLMVVVSSSILTTYNNDVDVYADLNDRAKTRRRLQADKSAPKSGDDPTAPTGDKRTDKGDTTIPENQNDTKGEKTPGDDTQGDTKPENTADENESNTDGATPDATEQETENSPSTPTEKDPCQDANSCQECQKKATALFDESSEHTCAFVPGTNDEIRCQKVKKSSIVDMEGDQCSKTTNEPDDTKSLVVQDKEESNAGAIVALISLLACGAIACKCRHRIISKMNASMGTGGGPAAKTTKYHEVAVDEENDEEWGWGEDDGPSTGDVELASSFKDDNSIHKRRTSSNDTLPTNKPSPMFQKKSPLLSGQVKSHVPTDHHVPKLPKAVSQPSASVTGMSLTTISKPGISLGTTTSGIIAPAPASAPARSTLLTSAPATEFGHLEGMKITSLGPKRTEATTPAKKVATPSPTPEDDICASMGISAMPTFSSSATKPTVTSSRWNSQSTPPPATLTTTETSFAGDGDDNWDDDGDLDDLLDD